MAYRAGNGTGVYGVGLTFGSQPTVSKTVHHAAVPYPSDAQAAPRPTMKAVVLEEHGTEEALQYVTVRSFTFFAVSLDLPSCLKTVVGALLCAVILQKYRPICLPDHVLIRVKACALSALDIGVRSGELSGAEVGVRLPLVPGYEISGVVEAVGPFASYSPSLCPALTLSLRPRALCRN